MNKTFVATWLCFYFAAIAEMCGCLDVLLDTLMGFVHSTGSLIITTGISVAHGRGVILLAAEKLGVPVFEYTPMQVKQAVAGYGGADKRQVMLMTQRLLSMKEVPRPDDAADALAIAICHARSATSLLNMERVFDPEKYDTR